MTIVRLLLAGFVCIAAAAAAMPSADPDAAAPRPVTAMPGPVRGMTVSCHGSGASWASDDMTTCMESLRDLGVTWICIHPYAGIGADGRVRHRRGEGRDEWITRPIREAHRLGLRIMIKPHIAYWGSPFSWRGAIDFQTEAQRAMFFATYETWITDVAELAKDADAFVVGTELDRLVEYDAEWRRIIDAVRTHTDAPLTFASNWDSYASVPFWDALDLIGVQAYFPLVAHEEMPSETEVQAGWKRVVTRLETYARKHERPVLLTEVGYNESNRAAVEPWQHRQHGPDGELVQCRCMNAALAAIEDSDLIVGTFLWKWFPNRTSRGNFLMTTPAMQSLIRDQWKPPAAAPDDGS